MQGFLSLSSVEFRSTCSLIRYGSVTRAIDDNQTCAAGGWSTGEIDVGCAGVGDGLATITLAAGAVDEDMYAPLADPENTASIV